MTIQDADKETDVFWKDSYHFLISFFVLAAAFVFALYGHGLKNMMYYWFEKEEYSHGVLIPFISAFLIWQKKDVLERIPFSGSRLGVAVTFAGAIIILIGNISAITIIMQYGFVIALAGQAFAYMGWRGFRVISVPILLLFFMFPLPDVIYRDLSLQLQLISSSLGVWVIRLFDISVYLEGNVIDLGTYKLQVVEACSGLRYLFPLMALGFICAYFYKAAFWKRTVVFLSTIPVTVLMNSFRIGMIGVLVEYQGISAAEGFLHDFEGWVVFMACTGILVLEMWLLARFGKDRRPLRQVFGLEFPAPTPKDVPTRYRPIGNTYWSAAVIIAVVIAGLFSIPAQRDDVKIARKEFVDFPMALGDWNGKADSMARMYVEALDLDDYLLANYVNNRQQAVNLYFAYYGSQSKGASIHSPRACLPGGGWLMRDFSQREMSGTGDGPRALRVNRAEIEWGESKQLVYYWFRMHGRNITNEYLLKWYVFWDALTMSRTDAALVRVTTPIRPGESFADADSRLIDFVKSVNPNIPGYVPD
jgi:exosortase D (VPLPA-CTERM-specific)